MAAYDPFTHRKKIPNFPSVFGGSVGTSGWQQTSQDDATNIGNKYRTPGARAGSVSFPNAIPPMPDAANETDAALTGQIPIPEVSPAGSPQLQTDSLGQDLTPDNIDDTSHAGNLISQLDEIQKSIDSIGQPADNQGGQVMDDTSASHMTPVDSRPADRSWMFQPKDGWDGPRTGSGNYAPAPVQFNDTNSDEWGNTGMDQRPQNNGPAPSTQRYYERALNRAESGNRSDARRVRRLDLRINGRPTNG